MNNGQNLTHISGTPIFLTGTPPLTNPFLAALRNLRTPSHSLPAPRAPSLVPGSVAESQDQQQPNTRRHAQLRRRRESGARRLQELPERRQGLRDWGHNAGEAGGLSAETEFGVVVGG